MPFARMRPAKSRTSGNGLRSTSSPKLSEPAFSVAISGGGVHSSGWARSSAVIPTAPPVLVWTITSVRRRMASRAFWKSARSWVGVPSSRRTWRWTTAAPASRHRAASAASSSAVTGRCGVISRVVSAPQIAAVMMAGLLTPPCLAQLPSGTLLPLLPSRSDAGAHRTAHDDRLAEEIGGGVAHVGAGRDVLAGLEAHLPAGLPRRDNLALHLHEVAGMERREELHRFVRPEQTLV